MAGSVVPTFLFSQGDKEMGDEYKPSDTPIKELEKGWLESQTGELDHLEMHRCSAALLAFEDPERVASFTPLFEDIARRLGLAPLEVKQKLCAAKNAGLLTLGGHLAVDVGVNLTEQLNSIRDRTPESSILQRVIVGEVEAKYQPGEIDRAAATARAAADYFANVVPTGPTKGESHDDFGRPTSKWVGFCGGRTILRMVERIIDNPKRYDGLTVLPLAGEADPENFQISANSVVARLEQRPGLGRISVSFLMGFPYLGPATVEQLLSWQEDRKEIESIKTVVDRSKRVKFAFAGIGDVGKSDAAIRRLKKYCQEPSALPSDCVGDMCYRPMDRSGRDTWPQLSNRVVGLTLNDLREMARCENRRVFAVACGKEKVKGIIAAVTGGLINGLITDELTALEIIDELKRA